MSVDINMTVSSVTIISHIWNTNSRLLYKMAEENEVSAHATKNSVTRVILDVTNAEDFHFLRRVYHLLSHQDTTNNMFLDICQFCFSWMTWHLSFFPNHHPTFLYLSTHTCDKVGYFNHTAGVRSLLGTSIHLPHYSYMNIGIFWSCGPENAVHINSGIARFFGAQGKWS
jgi:hypothetical protein